MPTAAAILEKRLSKTQFHKEKTVSQKLKKITFSIIYLLFTFFVTPIFFKKHAFQDTNIYLILVMEGGGGGRGEE